jgi:hypothetical protein
VTSVVTDELTPALVERAARRAASLAETEALEQAADALAGRSSCCRPAG